MINAISAADVAFIMSSSTSAWLLSPLECSPQKQNGWTLRFWSVSEDEVCEICMRKQLLNSVFAWYHELSKPRVCVICLSLRLRADNSDLGFDNSWYHAQPHPIIVFLILLRTQARSSLVNPSLQRCRNYTYFIGLRSNRNGGIAPPHASPSCKSGIQKKSTAKNSVYNFIFLS